MGSGWRTRVLRDTVGVVELLIGLWAIRFLMGSQADASLQRLIWLLSFEFLAACLSCVLGVGVILARDVARRWLVFFSILILLNKALTSFGVTVVESTVDFMVPQPVKDAVSCVYHGVVIIVFRLPQVRRTFQRSP